MRIAEIAIAVALLGANPATGAEPPQPHACDSLERADGKTDPRDIATALDALRSGGRDAWSAAGTLSALLPHRSRIFENRDKDLVIRLRAYILVTLSDIGTPESAYPALLDVLAHVDERASPLEVAAAARAVRSLGPRGGEFTPYLLDALTARVSVEELSLERFDLRFPASEATTAQLELVRALGAVAPLDDHELRETLEQVIADPDRDPRLVREARGVLGRTRAVVPAPARAHTATSGPWLSAARRPTAHVDIAYKDQDGRDGALGNLFDRPVLITFFYSRCQNGKKCSLAVSRMGALQRQLAQAGLDDRVRLVAITYEPQHDTPERINRFATERGMRLGTNALALQLDGAREQRALTDDLEAPVNYSSGWVNTHGVELTLLDSSARVVRQYRTVLWDNAQVVDDLRRLLAER